MVDFPLIVEEEEDEDDMWGVESVVFINVEVELCEEFSSLEMRLAPRIKINSIFSCCAVTSATILFRSGFISLPMSLMGKGASFVSWSIPCASSFCACCCLVTGVFLGSKKFFTFVMIDEVVESSLLFEKNKRVAGKELRRGGLGRKERRNDIVNTCCK